MIEKTVGSLEELEGEVSGLRKLIDDHKKHEYQPLSKVLFRGQRSSDWGLETTLERYSDKMFSVSLYDSVLNAIYPATASLTGEKWSVEDRAWDDSNKFFTTPPNYEFMVYARHHGFPSPLLDWTQSLYVALFFAYQNALPDIDVAVFAFIGTLSGGKGFWVGAPRISELGPYITSHSPTSPLNRFIGQEREAEPELWINSERENRGSAVQLYLKWDV